MKVIYKGKAVEVPDSHGWLLVQNGRAKLPAATDRAMKSEPEKMPESPDASGAQAVTTRTYKRRDMEPESGKSDKAKG